MITTTTTMKCVCDKCGHIWTPRLIGTPRICPQCKRATWNDGKK